MAKSRSGSEQRKLSSKPVGVRLNEHHDRMLNDLAATSGVTRAQYLRNLFLDHVEGGGTVRKIQSKILLDAGDRAALATFSRHSGRLTGALIQTAKAARVNGGLTSYHVAVETLLAETRNLKRRVDRLIEDNT